MRSISSRKTAPCTRAKPGASALRWAGSCGGGRKDGGRYANLQRGELPQRFAAVVSASSVEEVAHYLRQVVRLLRGAAVQLDYGRLARDLYDLQDSLRADAARLAWGRDYARQVETDKSQETEASEAADL